VVAKFFPFLGTQVLANKQRKHLDDTDDTDDATTKQRCKPYE